MLKRRNVNLEPESPLAESNKQVCDWQQQSFPLTASQTSDTICYISTSVSLLLCVQVPLDLSIPAILENISSPNPQNQLAGVQSCRKLLSKERNPPLDAIIA